MRAALLAFELTWNPGVTGVLVVAVSVIMLCGSVYMVIGTNTGFRLGFLIALTGLMGFMAMLGAVWWLYGIGIVGDAPAWQVRELVRSPDRADLSVAATPEVRSLDEWEELSLADPDVGEAGASADAALLDDNLGGFERSTDYVALGAFHFGGQPRWFSLRQTPEYLVIQVQRTIPVVVLEEGDGCPPGATCIEFGEAPPPPEPDTDAPIVSVVLLRDQGSIRLPPALITLGSLLIFLVLCHSLHRRDRLATELRAREEVPA